MKKYNPSQKEGFFIATISEGGVGIFIVMKYTISDERLIEIIHKFLNRKSKPEVVCDYLVYYDYDFDRIVVNIFYKKNTDHSDRYKIEASVMDKIEHIFGLSPFIYTHIGDC